MFCDFCGRDVPCGTELRERVVSIRGMSIPVQYRAHLCGVCGEEVYDEAAEACIMERAKEQYRTRKNMLPAERLQSFMRERGVSMAEMARRTGCAVEEIIAASTGRLLDLNADARIKKAVGA